MRSLRERVPSNKPRLLRLLGPGLITGASDDDPSGIGTYSQAGAQFGGDGGDGGSRGHHVRNEYFLIIDLTARTLNAANAELSRHKDGNPRAMTINLRPLLTLPKSKFSSTKLQWQSGFQ
jgi:hypothetical protein